MPRSKPQPKTCESSSDVPRSQSPDKKKKANVAKATCNKPPDEPPKVMVNRDAQIKALIDNFISEMIELDVALTTNNVKYLRRLR